MQQEKILRHDLMNYFVSIENSYYHGWQIELLIESFKQKSLEDSLYISVAKSDKEYLASNINYSNHKNKFIHENIGRKTGFIKHNKWSSLYSLLENNIISLPVVVLEPDVILCKEIDLNNIDVKFMFSVDSGFSYNKKFRKIINDTEEKIKKAWLSIGEIMIFNNLTLSFFKDINTYYQNTSLIYSASEAEKLAVLAAIWKNRITQVLGSFELESNLIDNRIGNVISYKHGINPYFNKKLYKNNNANF